MIKYVLADMITKVPIKAVGLCSEFKRKSEAETAAFIWNSHNKNKIVVTEKYYYKR